MRLPQRQMPSRHGAVLVFAVLVIIASFARAELLPVKTYTTADGLQRDLVSRIRQDSRGFLWFCTGEGVSRFDGLGMTNFTVADGLPHRIVNDFLETNSGSIYIATNKGLARLNPRGQRGSKDNPVFSVFLPDDPNSEKILILYEDRKNQVWIGTSDGLYKLIEKGAGVGFEPVPLGEPLEGFGGAIFVPSPKTLYVDAILEDRQGALWVGTFGSGLFRRSSDGSVRHFTAPAHFGDNKVTALAEDRSGTIWMGMRSDQSGGVCLLDAADAEKPVKQCYTEKDGLGSNRIRDILETSDGQMWLATVPGLCRWNGEGGSSVCKIYAANNDLCDEIYTLTEDREGNLWTGSNCGAKQIARYGFTTYNEADGLDKARINAMFENAAGELFVTSFPRNGRFVSRFDGEKFSTVKPRFPAYVDYHGWGWQQTVLQDHLGAWWISTGAGLFRSPDNTSFENLARARLEKQQTGAKGEEPFRIFEDSRGDIWVTTTTRDNELKRWERAKDIWHDYTAQAGMSEYRIGTAFIEDGQGNIWIGASSDHNDGALIRYRQGEFRVFTKADNAPSGWISDLFLDSRDRLWIATNDDGLLRLNDTNSERLDFFKYTPAEGLTSITTNCVTEDEFGRIYIGTWQGIDRLDPETGQVESFSTEDGLPSSYVESAYRDRNNNIWFMTDKGLARFRPEPLRQRKPPNILITGLLINGESQNISILGETSIPPLDLRSDQRQITIEFLGLGTSLGEQLKYEYRFGNANWTATNERILNFSNLPAGSYTFEVRAQTADRIYSQATAVVSFKIAAPIWQRWWFLLLIGLSIAASVYLIYRNRLQRLLELEKVRTRIATDLHDDIGANLTRISLLSEVAKQQSGHGSLLASIADIARESVSSMNDIVWAISPQHDRLLDLTRRMRQHAEEVFTLRDINLEFNAPVSERHVQLRVGTRRDVLLIFKEAVNNVARHSECTKVMIDFRSEHHLLRLNVSDNGRGFEPGSKSDGHGLRSMARRAATIGGELRIDSRPGEGTTVRFEMPL